MHRKWEAAFLISGCMILLSTTFLLTATVGQRRKLHGIPILMETESFLSITPQNGTLKMPESQSLISTDVGFWYHGHDYDTFASVLLATWLVDMSDIATGSAFPTGRDTTNSEFESLPSTPNSTLIQDTECSNFFINGFQACSVIYSTLNLAVTSISVNAVDKDKSAATSIVFFASDDVYEFFKPVFDHMVNSFKLNSGT